MKTALDVILLLLSFLPLTLFASVAKERFTANGLYDGALDLFGTWNSAMILGPLVICGILLSLGGLALVSGGRGESADN